MLKFAALAVLAIVPAAAQAQPPLKRSSVEGMELEYRRTVDADGILHLEGRDIASGERFRFAVAANGRVTGEVEDRPVAFRIDGEQRSQVAASIAAARSAPQLASVPAADVTTGQ
jgi:hypothetical protein